MTQLQHVDIFLEREVQHLNEKLAETNKTEDNTIQQSIMPEYEPNDHKDFNLQLVSKEREVAQLLAELQTASKSAQEWEAKYTGLKFTGILRDKTVDDKLFNIPNYHKHIYAFCRLNLFV